jgi:hypothetical protein
VEDHPAPPDRAALIGRLSLRAGAERLIVLEEDEIARLI